MGGSLASEPPSCGVNTDDINNNVNEDDFLLDQGVGDNGENNNNVRVSLQSPVTKAANTSASSKHK